MMRFGNMLVAGFALLANLAVAGPALADVPAAHQVIIEHGHFKPAQITIAAGKKVKLQVTNATGLPAEFESYDFTVEKVIPGHTSLPVYVGPLKPGTYTFINDFSPNVTGKLIVK